MHRDIAVLGGGHIHRALPEHPATRGCGTRRSPSPGEMLSFVKTLQARLAGSHLLYKNPTRFPPALLSYLSLWLCLPRGEGWHS